MRVLLSAIFFAHLLGAMDPAMSPVAITIKESEIQSICHNEEDEHDALISYVVHLKNGDIINADFDPIARLYICRRKTTWLDDTGRASYLLQPLSAQHFMWL